MKVLKIAVILVLCVVGSGKLYSQYYYYSDKYYESEYLVEFGVNMGIMSSVTDIGGASSDSKIYFNEFNKMAFTPGLYLGFTYQDFIGLRLNATWGKVEGSDANISGTSNNLVSKKNRNLNYRSNIVELALLAEFHPLMLHYYEDGPPRVSPYITAGVGYYSFKPQAMFDGRLIDLRPLRLEGQDFEEYPDRTTYKTSQVNVPIGAGLRYEINNFMNMRVEFLHRVLFTDYLDDASNRSWINPKLFDKYLTPVQAAYAKALYDPRIPGAKPSPARRGNPDDNDSFLSFCLRFGVTIGRRSR